MSWIPIIAFQAGLFLLGLALGYRLADDRWRRKMVQLREREIQLLETERAAVRETLRTLGAAGQEAADRLK